LNTFRLDLQSSLHNFDLSGKCGFDDLRITDSKAFP